MITLLAGIATSVLALFSVYLINTKAPDVNVMGWYANYVIPVGALLVGAVLAVVAYVLVKQGKERVAEAGAPIPEQTIETVKEDVEWAKTRASSARS